MSDIGDTSATNVVPRKVRGVRIIRGRTKRNATRTCEKRVAQPANQIDL